jgi:SAM-dependent methyltransferase
MAEHPAPDPEKLRDYARHVFGMMSGATVAGMIHLGDRLGLYKAMAGAGPVDAQGLAVKTGLSERWLREWLCTQGAGGVLEFRGEDRFELTPEAYAVLVDERHPANGAGFFAQLPHMMGLLERLPEAFQSGQGLPYDALGPEGARGVERGFAPWFRTLLVPVAIPRLDGVQAALEAGIQVADVGCGAGVALVELARAYPKSEFHGYDISAHALARAEENKKEAGLENLHFHDAARDPLPQDQRFGFITTFDCLHDMTRPADVVRGIGQAIAPEGTWLVADIKAQPSYEGNVAKNPMAALMYGFSVMVCMSSSLSEPDGAGLGTLGLHAELLEQMASDAGFGRFEPIDFGHPVNAFYVIRP